MNNQNYTYRRLKLEDLDSNKYYTFYRKDGKSFQGTFDSIIGMTLVIRDYRTGDIKENSAIRTLPKDWIAYVESEEFKIKLNNFLV